MTTIHVIERKPRTPPHASAKAPLLVLLHGYGSNERDLFELAEYFDPRFHILSARGLLDLGGGYAWYHLGGAPGNLRPDAATRDQALPILLKFIRSLPRRLDIDPKQIYLLGFSQGAIMSMALALQMPLELAGVVALSGYFDTDLLPDPLPSDLGKLPVLQLHGQFDEVIPVSAARQTSELLGKLPVDLHYQEFPIGHSINLEGIQLIQQWLSTRLAI